MGADRWQRVAASCLVAAAGLLGCASDPHPAVSDDQLACASATETGLTIGRGELGPQGASEDDRAAALLREVATVQFALEALAPEDPDIADGAGAVRAATDPADAVDEIVRLSATCERREVPIELDGAEHTTAACTQLRGVEDLAGEDDPSLSRLGFTARYAQGRVGDLDEGLAGYVEELDRAAQAEDRAAADAALGGAAARCAALRAAG